MATHLARVQLADPEVDSAELLMHPDLYTLARYVESVEEAREIEEEIEAEEIRDRGGVKTSEGPLTRVLDPVLQRYHAKRQAYHSQAFVGNHVNAILKEAPIKELTSVAANKAEELMMEHDFPIGLFTRAKDLETKYSRLFSLFSTCHQNYSHGRPVGEAELLSLAFPLNAILVTLNVYSLYTNITTDEGIKALQNDLADAPTEAICQLLGRI
ncbi:hypothetical protein Bbelb_272220 [Branchiostoma belcheri]|nr:hypothetical protein Bbelb_272220 [Branchiostoma belcheri]